MDEMDDVVMAEPTPRSGVVSLQDLMLPPARKPKAMNAKDFPEKPLLQKTKRHLRIRWQGRDIADTTNAYCVFQTHKPPTNNLGGEGCRFLAGGKTSLPRFTVYYIPPQDVNVRLIKTGYYPPCKHMGLRMHYALGKLDAYDGSTIANRVWAIEKPYAGYEAVAGYFCFYHSPWECFVDGERVQRLPCDFDGGWATKDIGGLSLGPHGVKRRMGKDGEPEVMIVD